MLSTLKRDQLTGQKKKNIKIKNKIPCGYKNFYIYLPRFAVTRKSLLLQTIDFPKPGNFACIQP